jgi:uncharacterized protein YlaI
MIHYTCDRCRRQIDTQLEPRFQINIEISTIAPTAVELDVDEQAARELLELEELIDELAEESPGGDPDAAHQHQTFDLCQDCHERFAQDPLARSAAAEMGFSKN